MWVWSADEMKLFPDVNVSETDLFTSEVFPTATSPTSTALQIFNLKQKQNTNNATGVHDQ